MGTHRKVDAHFYFIDYWMCPVMYYCSSSEHPIWSNGSCGNPCIYLYMGASSLNPFSGFSGSINPGSLLVDQLFRNSPH